MSTPVSSAAAAMRNAFLEGDFSVAAERLADDIAFNSPVLERPWMGRAVVERLGPAMVSLFEDIEFAPIITDGRRAILSFTGRQASVEVQAIEVLDVDDDGQIAELSIYVRPLPAVVAVAKAMEARIDPELLAAHVALGYRSRVAPAYT
jgi:SnoaL-like domain